MTFGQLRTVRDRVSHSSLLLSNLLGWHRVAVQEVKKIAQAMARQTERDESEVCSHAISRLSMLDCGGVKMLARMVWGTCAVKIEVQMGICLIVGGSKCLPGWFGALITINTLI